MSGTPDRRAVGDARFSARTARGRTWLAALIPLLLLAVLLLAQARAIAVRPLGLAFAGAAGDLTPTELTERAASGLEAVTAEGGSGYTFTIVQRTSLDARADGPLIDIPDPNDRHGSLGKTDHYEFAVYVERGSAAPGAFWLEIRDGPEPGKEPDFETATYRHGTLVRDGKAYRDDGDGWYESEDLPGLGLDPATATLLPAMLRGATDAKDAEAKPGDGTAAARTLEAGSKPADIPGIIAADLERATELVGPLELGFDDQGRLVSIHAIARNTNLDDKVDMLVDTTIAFDYPLLAPDIPRPDPLRKTGFTGQAEG